MLHVVTLSGGMDSFTLLHKVMALAKPGDQIECVAFDYGQRNRIELSFAQNEAWRHSLHLEVIDLSYLSSALMRGSALTDPTVLLPHGIYSDPNMKANVVPGRNALFIACAMAYAESMLARDAGFGNADIWFAVHRDPQGVYYADCSPGFFAGMAQAAEASSEGRVSLRTPFIKLTKGGIVAQGMLMRLDYSHSYSCYAGGDKPCGQCGACTERAEAFSQNNYTDAGV